MEDELKARISCLEQLNDEMVRNVAKLIEMNETLQGTVNDLNAKYTELKANHAELNAKHVELNAKHVELGIADQKKEADLREQQNEIANLTDKVGELSGQVARLNQRVDEVEIEKGAYYATHSDLTPKLKAELERIELDMAQISDDTQKASKSSKLAIKMLEKGFILPEFSKLKVNRKLKDRYIDDENNYTLFHFIWD